MAHSCPTCGQACYCDGEDTWWDEDEDCIHACDPADLKEDELEYVPGVEDESPIP